jgi:hypothetical protein
VLSRGSYLVILNDKKAELGALAEVDDEVRERVLPLIDFRDPAPRNGRRTPWTPYGHLSDHLLDPNWGLLGCWGSDLVLIDLRRVDRKRFDGRHPMDHVLSMCADAGIRAVPVTGRDRDADYRSQVAIHAARLGNGACIRLRDQDLTAGVAGATSLLKELDMPRSNIDLVLDLQQLETTGTFMAAAVAWKCLERFAPLDSWRSVTLAGSSFPNSLSEYLGYNEYAVLPRAERAVWSQVADLSDDSQPILFGDYGTLSATDPIAPYRGSANIRYAMERSWYVLRGHHRDKAPPSDYARLAGDLVASDIWMGADHCAGCAFLAARAETGVGGNSTQFRQAGFVHHLTVTCA